MFSGGNTLIPGFSDRMKKEISTLFPTNIRTKFIQSPRGVSSAWVGGSILANHNDFQSMWITKQQYTEDPTIIRRN
ncbi:hypothetical protein PPL_09726 [Heterostelium album PN500]|uniref:Actin n=1 Tax=Heterostelium pallidum (strain ATCC 26659 / Pp 5 / PN500) TaxID=670386 RepID=D3BNM3_HETP5|nr:hypothetical protein PPL_09726 [Heterostelium album PN500]EFA76974.1 hypothetical protein PPL_09726 [Heterostelium album PN500]|eukprot:XP_020429105.1 hypothetical protein PPL_09726 [Heterostelium album PN500]